MAPNTSDISIASSYINEAAKALKQIYWSPSLPWNNTAFVKACHTAFCNVLVDRHIPSVVEYGIYYSEKSKQYSVAPTSSATTGLGKLIAYTNGLSIITKRGSKTRKPAFVPCHNVNIQARHIEPGDLIVQPMSVYSDDKVIAIFPQDNVVKVLRGHATTVYNADDKITVRRKL